MDTYFGSRLAYYTAGDAPATVTITAGTGGTVDVQSLAVPVGTSVSASGNILTIGSDIVTATPDTGYHFASWSGIPASGTIDADTTITAVFEIDTHTVTITVNDPSYGSVSVSSVTVDYGTPIGIDTQTGLFTVGSTAVTATPSPATAQYRYEFESWSWVPTLDAVTEDITATATFSRWTNEYTVTVAVNDSAYGSVSRASVTVDYGTSISASAAVLTVGSSTSTATPTS